MTTEKTATETTIVYDEESAAPDADASDPKAWEKGFRHVLRTLPSARAVAVPRCWLDQAIKDIDGYRDTARYIGGEEFVGR